MAGRPIDAAPPLQAGDHPQTDVGLDDLHIPNDSAPFPALEGAEGLPDAADGGISMSDGHMPDSLPDFLV